MSQALMMKSKLSDYRWRFTHLYYIKPADKRSRLLFDPKDEQWEILDVQIPEDKPEAAPAGGGSSRPPPTSITAATILR